MPDDNECKVSAFDSDALYNILTNERNNLIFLKYKNFILIQYRPCDVFGYCTNTIGGYFCSCREGYTGDGKECRDIDECKDPELASLCVENAECCNLPAHFVCKCNEGFEGDGTKECRGKKMINMIVTKTQCLRCFDLKIQKILLLISFVNSMISSKG